MELRDVYRRDGTRTGEVLEKHAVRSSGQYFLHALMILKTPDDFYLLQQRSLKSRFFPGAWDLTGGGASAGENSRQAAVRETWEELGLRVPPESLRFVLRETQEEGQLLVDVYLAQVEIRLPQLRLAPMEVNDARLVDYGTFYDAAVKSRSEAFREALTRTLKEIS